MKYLHILLLLVFGTLSVKAKDKHNTEEKNLLCFFLTDFIDSTLRDSSYVVLKSELNQHDQSNYWLRNYLTQEKIYKKADKELKIKNFNCRLEDLNCISKGFKIVADNQEYDSLASLYSVMLFYDELKESGTFDNSNIPEKIDLKYIPLEVGVPVFWNDYAVISYNTGAATSYLIYYCSNKTWKKLGYIYIH